MKLLLSLLLPILALSVSCPDPLGHTYAINENLTMYFHVVLSEPDIYDSSILCTRFESLSDGWIGFGISPTKGMVGAEAIIGSPASNTVKKYMLLGKDVSMVTEMDDANQTLMDTSIVQDEEGKTTMTFSKYLFEDKYGIIPNDFINSFIWATGSTDDLSYHGSTRGSFGMDLSTTLSPISTPETRMPSLAVANGTSAPLIAGDVTLSPSMSVTTSPAAVDREDITPTPSAVHETIDDSHASPIDVISDTAQTTVSPLAEETTNGSTTASGGISESSDFDVAATPATSMAVVENDTETNNEETGGFESTSPVDGAEYNRSSAITHKAFGVVLVCTMMLCSTFGL